MSIEIVKVIGGNASHNRGIGSAAWQAIEEQYPETKVWELVTPYFEKHIFM